jgi:hypothetical protein
MAILSTFALRSKTIIDSLQLAKGNVTRRGSFWMVQGRDPVFLTYDMNTTPKALSSKWRSVPIQLGIKQIQRRPVLKQLTIVTCKKVLILATNPQELR